MPKIEEILGSVLMSGPREESKPATPDQLKALRKSFRTCTVLAPGDIAQWKQGMRNKRSQGPFIIMDVLSKPVRPTEEDTSSPYRNEHLDVLCGFTEPDGTFSELLIDSRRLEHFVETPAQELQ